MNTFEWLESSALSEWVGVSLMGYPMMLVCHAIGLAVVVGILFMLNLRLLGLFPGVGFSAMRPMVKLAWLGFLLNLASGFALFTAQATIFVDSTPFLIKIAAIFLAGINAALLQSLMRQQGDQWDAGAPLSSGVKLLALVSLVLWSTAIIAGRMIAYLDVG